VEKNAKAHIGEGDTVQRRRRMMLLVRSSAGRPSQMQM